MSEWSGRFVDAAGRIGTIEADLPDEPGEGRAEWRVLLTERDGGPSEFTGTIRYERVERERVHLQAEEELPDGKRVRWEVQLQETDAGQHAERALVGDYHVETDAEPGVVPVTRGVMVLWRYGQ
jgi:hypothetical protein